MYQEVIARRVNTAVAKRATPLDEAEDDACVTLADPRPITGPTRVPKARQARQYRYVVLHFCKAEVLENDGSFQMLHELLFDGWVPVRELPMGCSGGAHSHAWALVLLAKES
jgi:hypothetical protein